MEDSAIEWTDCTVNFWHGCEKISEGCKFCYMYRDKAVYGQDPKLIKRSKDPTFYRALKWKDPQLIFTCSWSDFFIPQADPWRDDAWEVIRDTPHHIWQILTKREGRIPQCLPKDWEHGYRNVWLGVSIENQKRADRIKGLMQVPARVHFLSVEPLIDEVKDLDLTGIEWLIIGGESGNETGKYRYRPCKLEWIEQVVEEAKAAGVPVFVKQLGTYLAKKMNLSDRKGGKLHEFPEHLQLREYPRPNNTPSLEFLLEPLLDINRMEQALDSAMYESKLFSTNGNFAARDQRKKMFETVNKRVAEGLDIYLNSNEAITENAVAETVAAVFNKQRLVHRGYSPYQITQRIFRHDFEKLPKLNDLARKQGLWEVKVKNLYEKEKYILRGIESKQGMYFREFRKAYNFMLDNFLVLRQPKQVKRLVA